jgi:hypothetical protein
MSTGTNIKWELIIEKIKEETTILCLGADIFTHTIGGRLDDHLREAVGQPDDVHMYENGLFHFRNETELHAHNEIKKFYNQDFPDK